MLFRSVGIVQVLMKMFKPFIWILTKSTNFFMKLFRIKESKDTEFDEEELKKLIVFSRQEGVIDHADADLLMSVFEFGEIEIKELMTPLKDVIAVPTGIDISKLVNIIAKSGHSRIPMYEDEKNNIVGIINVKDLVLFQNKKATFKDIIKKPFFVFESDKADIVYETMKEQNNEIAVVQNHQHEEIGIVTNEDLIKEILGERYKKENKKTKAKTSV